MASCCVLGSTGQMPPSFVKAPEHTGWQPLKLLLSEEMAYAGLEPSQKAAAVRAAEPRKLLQNRPGAPPCSPLRGPHTACRVSLLKAHPVKPCSPAMRQAAGQGA